MEIIGRGLCNTDVRNMTSSRDRNGETIAQVESEKSMDTYTESLENRARDINPEDDIDYSAALAETM